MPITWTFLSAALLTYLLERFPRAAPHQVLAFAFAAGAIHSFVSLLQNPPLEAGLISFVVIAWRLRSEIGQRHRAALIDGILASAAWFAGYGLTWSVKWFLAAAVVGWSSAFSTVGGTVQNYLVDSPLGAYTFLGAFFFVTGQALHFWPITGLAVLAACATLALTAAKRPLPKGSLWDLALLQTPVLLQISWVEVMRLHSVTHAGFVVRNLLLLAICPCRILRLQAEQRSGGPVATGWSSG